MLCLSGFALYSDLYLEANHTTRRVAERMFPGPFSCNGSAFVTSPRSLKLYLISRSIFQMPGAPANYVGEFSGAEFLRL